MTTNDDDAGCVAMAVVLVILAVALALVAGVGVLLWWLAGRVVG